MLWINKNRKWAKSRNPRVQKRCIYCKKSFKVIFCRAIIAKFCSILCYRKYNRGANNPSWKGGSYITKNGYKMIYMPNHSRSVQNGYILEHRYIMEKVLKRSLLSWEVIHHKNGIKIDNGVKNLELVTQAKNLMYKNIALKCPNCGHLFNEIT